MNSAWRNKFFSAALSVFAIGPLHYPERAAMKANLTQPPTTAEQSPSRNPLDGCVYGVAKDNKIAQGLENVIAVSQAGAGYKVGDVFYKLETGFFIVARGATKAYRVQGEIPPQAIANGVRIAPLFIQECRSMPKGSTPQPPAKPAP